jgi:hypothetical protein
VTLQDATRALDVSWWVEGLNLKFVIPPTAAPDAFTPNYFTVDLVGTSGQAADVPQQLKVNPTPPPNIVSFNPSLGVPFTQVNVFGANFVNVKSVTFNGTNVYWVVVSPTQILAITHASLAPGWYSINVTTSTGSDATSLAHAGLFHALHAPIVPIYQPNVFSSVAVWAQHNTTGGNGDTANLYVKFTLNSSVNIGADTGLKLVNVMSGCKGADADTSGLCNGFYYNPFKPGNQPPVPFGTLVCNSGLTYVMQYNASLPNYVSSTFTYAFYLEFTFSKTGGASESGSNPLHTVTVTTNDPSQYFNLAPTDPELIVFDHGQPANGSFQNCG